MLTEDHSRLALDSISYAMDAIKYEWVNTAVCYQEAAAMFKPRLFIDGNQWCALYGENLQDGLAGFGDSPAQAIEDFNRNYTTSLTE